jgi:hypothetical protein
MAMKDTDNTIGSAADNEIALGGFTQAYVKAVAMDGAVSYGIHTPDGELLGIAPSRDIAFAVARQHELDPVSVH